MNAPRQPRVFAPDDPDLVVDASPDVDGAPADPADPAAGEATATRPTLAELGRRGLRWGLLLAAALTGAAILSLMAWLARFVSAALARQDWIASATLALLLTAAFAALMIVLRELIGFARVSRLGRLKAEIAVAIAERDRKAERTAAERVAGLYAGRGAQARACGASGSTRAMCTTPASSWPCWSARSCCRWTERPAGW
jgi:putative membrane protein